MEQTGWPVQKGQLSLGLMDSLYSYRLELISYMTVKFDCGFVPSAPFVEYTDGTCQVLSSLSRHDLD